MPWGQIVLFIVTSIISRLIAPKPPKPAPARLGDVDVPTAEEGRPIPVVFGTRLVRGSNIVWFGDLRTTPIKQSGGSKK